MENIIDREKAINIRNYIFRRLRGQHPLLRMLTELCDITDLIGGRQRQSGVRSADCFVHCFVHRDGSTVAGIYYCTGSLGLAAAEFKSAAATGRATKKPRAKPPSPARQRSASPRSPTAPAPNTISTASCLRPRPSRCEPIRAGCASRSSSTRP